MLTNDFAYYSAFWNAITYILFFIGLVSSLYYYMKGGKVHPLNPLWVIMCFVLVVLLMGYVYWTYLQVFVDNGTLPYAFMDYSV